MPQTYNQTIAELEKILNDLRGSNCDVDTLAEQTHRAAVLIKECRARLTRTEEELNAVLTELSNTLEN